MWGTVLGFGTKLFGAIGKFFDWRERKSHEKAGRQSEQIDQWERAHDAEKRMDDVERPGPDDTVDRLRDGKY